MRWATGLWPTDMAVPCSTAAGRGLARGHRRRTGCRWPAATSPARAPARRRWANRVKTRATTDTMADLGHSTVKGPPPLPAQARASDLSDSKIGRKIREAKHLPMAKPLESGRPASEFVIPIDDLLAASRPRDSDATGDRRANGRLSPASARTPCPPGRGSPLRSGCWWPPQSPWSLTF